MNLGAPALIHIAFQPYRIHMYVVRSTLLHPPALAGPSTPQRDTWSSPSTRQSCGLMRRVVGAGSIVALGRKACTCAVLFCLLRKSYLLLMVYMFLLALSAYWIEYCEIATTINCSSRYRGGVVNPTYPSFHTCTPETPVELDHRERMKND